MSGLEILVMICTFLNLFGIVAGGSWLLIRRSVAEQLASIQRELAHCICAEYRGASKRCAAVYHYSQPKRRRHWANRAYRR